MTNSGLRSTTLIRVVAVVVLLPTLVGVAIFIVIALLPTPPVTDFDPNADVGLRGTIESVITRDPLAEVVALFLNAIHAPVP